MRQLLTSLHALAHRLGSQVALIRLRWPDIFHILRGGPDRGPSVHRSVDRAELGAELQAGLRQADFALLCRRYHRRPLRPPALMILLTAQAFRDGSLDTVRHGLAQIEALRDAGEPADRHVQMIEPMLEEGVLNPVDGLYLLAAIEGDGPRTAWVRLAEHLLRSAEAGDLALVRRLFAISRGPVAKSFRQRDAGFFQNMRGLRRINREALAAAGRLLDGPPIPDHAQLHGAPRFVFVATRFFADADNTHFNSLANVARAVRAGFPEAQLHLALSCEDCVQTPWGRIGGPERDTIAMHQRKWHEAVGPNGLVRPDTPGEEGLVPWLEGIAPQLVIFIGGNYQSHIDRIECFRRFPTLVFATSVQFKPDAWSDSFVSTTEVGAEHIALTDPDKVLRLPTPARAFQSEAAYGGPPLRRRDDDFVMVTVLGNQRLAEQFERLDADTLERLRELFDRHPQLVWVLVGEDRIERVLACSPHLRALHAAGRLKCLGHVAQLRGLFREADAVFVIPGMSGGNQSVIAALHEGLPAIAGRAADSSEILPMEALYADDAGAVDLLERLVTDPEFRETLRARCAGELAAHAIENVGPAWRQGIEQTIERGRARLFPVPLTPEEHCNTRDIT